MNFLYSQKWLVPIYKNPSYLFKPVWLQNFGCRKQLPLIWVGGWVVFSSCQLLSRRSHRRSAMEKGVLKNFAKFTEKHLCQSLYFNKVASLNFAKFLRTPFLTDHLRTTASVNLLFFKSRRISLQYLNFKSNIRLKKFAENI